MDPSMEETVVGLMDFGLVYLQSDGGFSAHHGSGSRGLHPPPWQPQPWLPLLVP